MRGCVSKTTIVFLTAYVCIDSVLNCVCVSVGIIVYRHIRVYYIGLALLHRIGMSFFLFANHVIMLYFAVTHCQLMDWVRARFNHNHSLNPSTATASDLCEFAGIGCRRFWRRFDRDYCFSSMPVNDMAYHWWNYAMVYLFVDWRIWRRACDDSFMMQLYINCTFEALCCKTFYIVLMERKKPFDGTERDKVFHSRVFDCAHHNFAWILYSESNYPLYIVKLLIL